MVDRLVAARLLDALAPEEIALALAAADEVSARKANHNRALELRVERTRYEAARGFTPLPRHLQLGLAKICARPSGFRVTSGRGRGALDLN